MITVPAHKSNYTKGRTASIDRIVLHYTAGDGDSAVNNGVYFSMEDRKTSAHYFVDQNTVVLSVMEEDTAWHAGDWDMNCRSIGVEMCSEKDADGNYFIPIQTVQNAASLVKELMAKYKIGVESVIRHYDVTGKSCPAPMVTAPELWEDFKSRLVTAKSPSAWAEEATSWAVEQGLFQGDGQGDYQWQSPVTREQLAVILHRLQK